MSALSQIAQQVIDDACAIQQIPAPTFHEQERAIFLLSQWKNLYQIISEIDEAGNVLTYLPGKETKFQLVITAHLDTVFPSEFPLILKRDDNRIYGPGIGDNALGCATLLYIPTLIEKFSLNHGNIWLVATTGEEGLGNLKGMHALLKRFKNIPTVYLSLEGIGLGCILHRGLGVNRYRIEIQTRGGHSWTDAGSPSAIHEIVRLTRQLLDIKLPTSPRTTLNIGTIHGGTSINSIASHAFIEVDVRSESSNILEIIEKQVQDILHQYSFDDVQVSLTPVGNRPAGSISEYHPLVKLIENILNEINIPFKKDIASTEANLPLHFGIPAVTIGITRGARAHTAEEFIECAPVQYGLLQLAEIIRKIWEDTLF